jgi:hypothetical protein
MNQRTNATARPTQTHLIADVLEKSSGPLTDVELVSALDEACSDWTKAKDHAGKIGITHRVLYKNLEHHCALDILGVPLEGRGPRFEMVRVGGQTRWRIKK